MRAQTCMSIANSANVIEKERDWFNDVLQTRIKLYFEQECEYGSIYDIAPPDLSQNSSEYARSIQQFNLGFDERIAIMLGMMPHISPHTLDTFFIRNSNFNRSFTEFGGWKGKTHGGFLPTCETLSFILAGEDISKRLHVTLMLDRSAVLRANNVLELELSANGEPFFSSNLSVTEEYLTKVTSGRAYRPDYSTRFPAKRLSSELTWNDLVLPAAVEEEVENIKTWIQHSNTLLEQWGLKKNLKPGYRSLFYGPPGTGKTLTAALIGISLDIDVYRIDLSMVVSKYIGETEKNLANVFDQAENRNWILLFDEADALFGKRTQTASANDRYANQEVSYLLQRIEDFPGVVILATNLKGNIDEAFARRFQSLVYFPMPDSEQRLRLWQVALDGKQGAHKNLDLVELAERYPLAGGAINNVVRFAAIRALRQGRKRIIQEDLVNGVAKELRKEGKTV